MKSGLFEKQSKIDLSDRLKMLNDLSSDEVENLFERLVVNKHIPKEYWALSRNTNKEIHKSDGMLSSDLEYYFYVGFDALRIIYLVLNELNLSPLTVKNILDFPCGYGRVSRWLDSFFSNSSLVTSDLLRSAVDFNMEVLGSVGYYSKMDLNEVKLPSATFDLIWVGSLFTHLPEMRIRECLKLFYRLMTPGGLLFISLHGSYVAERIISGEKTYNIEPEELSDFIESYQQSDFAFANYKNQNGYGISVLNIEFLNNLLIDFDFELIKYLERGWVNHQDVIVLRKPV